MVEVTTTVQMQSIMNDILVKVFDKVSDKISEDFREDYLIKIAYRGFTGYSGNVIYNNPDEAGSFLNSWKWKDIKFNANEVTREFWHDWEGMNGPEPEAFGTRTGIHGSLIGGKWDVDERKYLATTLNKSEPSSSLAISVGRPGAYWSDFISNYVESGKLKQEFDKAFSSFGIKSG